MDGNLCKGVLLKPKVFIGVALYNMLAENTKKLQSLIKEKGVAKAEAMVGEGDLPPKPAGVLIVRDEALPEANPIVSKEMGSSSDAPGIPIPTNALMEEYLPTHESAAGTWSRHHENPSSSSRRKRRRKADSIPLVPGKEWYYLGAPSSDLSSEDED